MESDKNLKIERALKEIFKLKNDVATEMRIVTLDSFSGEFADFPEALAPEVVEVYKRRGIERLFSHQAEAIGRILAGDQYWGR